jgi:type IV secretory pathway VirB9-like protein
MAIEKEAKLAEKRENDKKRIREIPVSGKEAVNFNNNKNSYSFKSPSNGIGIFDDKDFVNLLDKTSGEKISEDVNKKRDEKDESWKTSGKMLSSKDIMNKLFDNLL